MGRCASVLTSQNIGNRFVISWLPHEMICGGGWAVLVYKMSLHHATDSKACSIAILPLV